MVAASSHLALGFLRVVMRIKRHFTLMQAIVAAILGTGAGLYVWPPVLSKHFEKLRRAGKGVAPDSSETAGPQNPSEATT